MKGKFGKLARLVLLLIAVAPASVAAQGADGARFLNACGAAVKQQDGVNISHDEVIGSVWCVGYVAGFVDSISVAPKIGGTRQNICLPQQGISNEQAIRLFVKYLRENPQVLHESGRMSLFITLAQTFPCK